MLLYGRGVATALLSVFDKSGVVELATGLHDLGWRLISSGGTAKAIADAGLPVTDLAELTGFPAILGHRVVTLHPAIHGGLLADLDQPEHLADLEKYGIEPFALAVVNLYPFSTNPSIDLIDIGGPTLIRAAAKNHAHVGVVMDPAQYEPVLNEIREHGALTATTRRSLAATAFARIAAYDAEIANWFAADAEQPLPSSLHLSLDLAQPLRYGENPHQEGARYRRAGATSWWDTAVQHGGKELSYLNVYDTEAAWRMVNRFDAPAVVIVKHANPCGVAVRDTIAEAYVLANACDPVSAFGGIVAANREVDAEMATALAPVFTEVVVAPSFTPEALAILTAKKNMRVLSASSAPAAGLDVRAIDGGLLVQQADTVTMDRSTWTVVTETQPTDAQWDDLAFAWLVCAAVSSNAIVFAKDRQAFGIGAGQQNRVDSARIAQNRSAGRAVGGVCASDAFFPFPDGLEVAAEAGVTAVIQPGGSVNDHLVIAAANEHGLAMVFTGERHFRH
ncbi:MAG: phosphoribosylaminoimidazolecarboxamide formyltransferase/IMP cyclohydrolase [Ilumatobacteraceae bacterium]|nr:phosphoribosylaminoimidazolecarboxamide formyltransferase/IMP cyclohydrolase [Ilumatobacteraceae bacterium]